MAKSSDDNTIVILAGLGIAYYLYSTGAFSSFSLASLLPASLTSVVANPVIANAVSCAVGQALSNGVCTQCPPGYTVQGPIYNQQYCVAPND